MMTLALWQANAQRHLQRAEGVLQVEPLEGKSPEAEALLRLRQAWPTPHQKSRSWADWDESQTEAFDHLLAARKFGPHPHGSQLKAASSDYQGVASLFRGATEWFGPQKRTFNFVCINCISSRCFLAVVMVMLLTMAST
eukprot:symbB.v1.2.028172.t2/scaffold2961.1/size66437/4